MILPDDLYLNQIKTKRVYFDKDSKEEFTEIVKGKYKLCGLVKDDIITKTIELYRFFVGTSNKQACVSRLTVEIKKHDYVFIEKDSKYSSSLMVGVGYYDINKIDVIDKGELLAKLKKTSFEYVAEITFDKFGELTKKSLLLRKTEKKSTEKVKHIVEALIRETDDVNSIMLKIGL